YADFALWQRQWLRGEALESQLCYWRRQLSGLVPLKLPVDHPRPAVQSHRGAVHHFAFPSELAETLRHLGQQEGVTPFIVLLMTFQILLHRYCHQDDIAVGSDLANRSKLETEGLIGFFINQIILRTNLAGNPICRHLLRQVRAMTLDAYLHQDLPFEKLVEVLQPERSLQSAPLFQAKIILQHLAPVRTGDGESARAALAVSDLSLSGETTQLDLIFRIFQTPQGFSGAFTYCRDLFEPGTIEQMAQHFLTLLASIGANPDARISELDMLSQGEKEQKQMEQKKIANTALAKFKAIKPQRMTVKQEALVQTVPLFVDQPLPLVVQPQQSNLDLVEWAENNLPWIESSLLKHGALLFRGFSLATPAVFERFAMKLCPDIFSENGEHVPVEGVGSGNLYTPVFYAPEKKLLWHNENSFNDSWPMKILFHCSHPAAEGGETPIADSRKVYSLLDSQIREEFLQKDIMYVRNYGEGLGLNWQTVFRTEEKAAVEAYCRKAAIEITWKGHDRLRTRQVRPAVVKHPQTGEFVWWNQATHWHPTCLDPEVRESLRALFSEEDQPRNCFYGDGTPIDDSVIEAICAAYSAAEISFPWQVGDVLLLDNMLVAHARNPYKGPRKIYVAMGGMITMHDPSLNWRGVKDHSF
ncbi:MAG TPA: condensation domain-containing protein, partial [Ktedonobacteraceae bacterium]|nr:condensation domain-containing protein [Ktedonobacteraceae bacterium]